MLVKAGEQFPDSDKTDTHSRVGYAGHEYDLNTDLVYMKARFYDADIGRFYSLDPVGYTTQNPSQSFNRYLYVNNNPYAYTDPDGEFFDTAVDIFTTAYEVGQAAVAFATTVYALETGNDKLAHISHTDYKEQVGDAIVSAAGLATPGVPAIMLVAGKNAAKAANVAAPKFPKDQVSSGARRLAREAMKEKRPEKAKALRELIPKSQKDALSKHYDNVADYNESKRGSSIQVDLQRGRARFLSGKTNTPPGNAANFNKKSLK